MAVSAVWRLVHFLAPCPSEPFYPPPYTGGTPVPLSRSPKAIGFWYEFCLKFSSKTLKKGIDYSDFHNK